MPEEKANVIGSKGRLLLATLAGVQSAAVMDSHTN